MSEPETKAILSKILPEAVVCFEQIGALKGSLFPQESDLLGSRASDKRRQEFAAGRTCARSALGLLGAPQIPLLYGQQREPLWPRGVVGSITHCEGYCSAAVAFMENFASIGIDAEPNESLPTEVLELITVELERDWLLNAPKEEICWDRLLFSIKESIYKVWYPIAQCWLDFEQVVVKIDVGASTFLADILHPEISSPRTIKGNYLATDSLLLTCAWVSTVGADLRLSQSRLPGMIKEHLGTLASAG